MRILTEAAGCLTAGYLIRMVKESGNTSIATDAAEDCFGKHLADEFYTVPFANSPESRNALFDLAVSKKIDIVVPTLDDSLLTWANMKAELTAFGTNVCISAAETLEVFLDKWKTYQFFEQHGIPTPKTSLQQEYPLVKPRNGRGGTGVVIPDGRVSMDGCISQELLIGTEYTVDVFCNADGEPVYIVPRIRIGVKDGKATGGVTVRHEAIELIVRKICGAIPFWGPINIQCFELGNGEIKVTEINPRLGGGSILGMAATENWMNLIVKMVNGESVHASVPVQYGLKMGRYYNEVFYR